MSGEDLAGNTFSIASTTDGSAVNIDRTSPTVTAVSSNDTNATKIIGNTVNVKVTFSEAVTVTGTPQLTLATGQNNGAGTAVDYSSGSGSADLIFQYTVAAGDTSTDLDYVAADSLALNGGTIKDSHGNDAVLTLAEPGAANSLGANKYFIIDGIVPTVTGVSSDDDHTATKKIGDTVDVKVTFDQAVTVTDTPTLTLATGGAGTAVNYTSGTGTANLIFRYTVAENDASADLDYVATTSLSGTIKSAAGNAADLTLPTPGNGNVGSLANAKAFVIDLSLIHI